MEPPVQLVHVIDKDEAKTVQKPPQKQLLFSVLDPDLLILVESCNTRYALFPHQSLLIVRYFQNNVCDGAPSLTEVNTQPQILRNCIVWLKQAGSCL